MVFSIWFLVTGWCNEKKYIPKYQTTKLCCLISFQWRPWRCIIWNYSKHQSRMHVLIWGELILWHFNFSEFSLGLLPENKNIFIDRREFQIDDYVLQSALNFGNLKVQDNYQAIYQILINSTRYLRNWVPLEKWLGQVSSIWNFLFDYPNKKRWPIIFFIWSNPRNQGTSNITSLGNCDPILEPFRDFKIPFTWIWPDEKYNGYLLLYAK